MNTTLRARLASLIALGSVALGIAACAAPTTTAEAEEEARSTQSDLIRPIPFYESCTSDCTATGGAPITESTCGTCTADHASVTCDGVVTKCAVPAPTCHEPAKPVGGCAAGWHWCGCPDPSDPYPRGWVCGVCR